MKIIKAGHLGMCFGVRDAIDLALRERAAGPVTVLGDLVHNPTVLNRLRSGGVAFAHRVEEVSTPTVMITAHGASNRMLAYTRVHGLHVVEATCPLVTVAHRAARSLVDAGYHPVVIGQRSHVEVRGVTEDLEHVDVILEDDDVLRLEEHAKLGVLAQTTQSIDRVHHLVALIRDRFPRSDIRFIDTVCRPTKQRQTAAMQLAVQCDVVFVVGGAHSNNTRELVKTCARFCQRVHHVEAASEVRPRWLDRALTVGITAGTSTPDDVIDAVERRIQDLSMASDRRPSLTEEPGA